MSIHPDKSFDEDSRLNVLSILAQLRLSKSLQSRMDPSQKQGRALDNLRTRELMELVVLTVTYGGMAKKGLDAMSPL